MPRSESLRVLFIRPPFTRLKGTGQAPYYPLGIGYLTSVVNAIEGVTAKLYYPENTPAEETGYTIDKKGVFESRSISQKRYFSAVSSNDHPAWAELRAILIEYKPHIIGISLLTPEVASTAKCIEIVKRIVPECLVICGGIHPTFEPADTLAIKGVDYIVLGEGETAIARFVVAIRDNVVPSNIPGLYDGKSTSSRVFSPCEQINSLDTIPFPSRSHSFFPERFSNVAVGSIMHSRGCPWRCGFCSSRRFWQERVRFRNAQNVVEEIKSIHRQFGIRTFTFWDDAFTIDRDVTGALCEEILRMDQRIAWRTATRQDLLDDQMIRLMKRAGCVQLELGIETGSPRMLEIIRKDIDIKDTPGVIDRVNRHGIACGVFLMAGFPDETEQDLEQTLTFIKQIKPAEIVLNIFDPMPGSEQFDRAKELGLIAQNTNFSRFEYWPDAHYVAGIQPDRFNEMIGTISQYVFNYNTSLPALRRRALPELKRLFQIDKKSLFNKGMRFFSNRFFRHV